MKRFWESIKAKRVYFLILLIFWIIAFIIGNPMGDSDTNNVYSHFGEEERGVHLLEKSGDVISQKFTAQEDGLNSVSLKFGTGMKTNYGTLRVDILDENGVSVASSDVMLDTLQDNRFQKIPFATQKDSKGKTYTIYINTLGIDAGDLIGIYYADNPGNMENAVINGEDSGGVLAAYVYYYSDTVMYLRLLAWAGLFLLSFICLIWVKGISEKDFLKIAILIGMASVVLTRFPHAIDESTHFFRSFMISEGKLADEVEEGLIGGYVSDNYEDVLSENLSVNEYLSNPELWNSSFSEDKAFYENPYMASVAPSNHIIGALGILIARCAGLSVVWTIILGRLFDFAFYTLFCYLAIKNARYYKSMFFVLSLLPMSIWLAGSFSLDPILISSALLFASITLKYYFDRELMVTKTDMVLMLICAVFIVSVKYLVYSPLCLMFFLIPRKAFTKKQYRFELIAAILLIAVFAVLQLYLLKTFSFTEDRNGNVDVAEQLAFALGHPGYTVRVLTDFLMSGRYIPLQSMAKLGSSVYGVIEVIGRVMSFFVFIAAAIAPDKYDFGDRKKKGFIALMAMIFAVVTVLVTVSLYFGYTPIGGSTVDGVQARYFIPILICAMMVFSFIPLKNNIKKYETTLPFIMMLGLLNMQLYNAGMMFSLSI